MKTKILTEMIVEGKRLGRNIKHDERSLAYDLKQLVDADAQLQSKAWERHCPPFSQGDIGSCTGNACAGLLMTDPFYVEGRNFTEADAIRLYSQATHIDPINGQSYPPDDTGSNGLDVMKAAQQDGYITGYHHGFDLETVQKYVATEGCVILGINWYSSFDQPASDGSVSITRSAYMRGGHEVEVAEIDVKNEWFGVWNSWGTDWGVGGKFYIPFKVMERLLSEDGDVTAAVTAKVA